MTNYIVWLNWERRQENEPWKESLFEEMKAWGEINRVRGKSTSNRTDNLTIIFEPVGNMQMVTVSCFWDCDFCRNNVVFLMRSC